jgi:hypothetical protein
MKKAHPHWRGAFCSVNDLVYFLDFFAFALIALAATLGFAAFTLTALAATFGFAAFAFVAIDSTPPSVG